MYYIFNSEQKIIGWCDFEPDIEDLNSRGEYYIFETETIQDPIKIVVGKYGTIFEPADNPKTQEVLKLEQSNLIHTKRNKLLSDSDWMINRHFEQKMLNISTTLSDHNFQELLDYRQLLRDLTLVNNFPFVEMPTLVLEE